MTISIQNNHTLRSKYHSTIIIWNEFTNDDIGCTRDKITTMLDQIVSMCNDTALTNA